ncbi:MAG TPA: hypothetical protein VK040_05500 [Balneolaceae bacterium]|nr:hypothetical protein [Balneolaceae bacterium]
MKFPITQMQRRQAESTHSERDPVIAGWPPHGDSEAGLEGGYDCNLLRQRKFQRACRRPRYRAAPLLQRDDYREAIR